MHALTRCFSASSTFKDQSDSALSIPNSFAAARAVNVGAPRPAATNLKRHQPAHCNARPASQHSSDAVDKSGMRSGQVLNIFWGEVLEVLEASEYNSPVPARACRHARSAKHRQRAAAHRSAPDEPAALAARADPAAAVGPGDPAKHGARGRAHAIRGQGRRLRWLLVPSAPQPLLPHLRSHALQMHAGYCVNQKAHWQVDDTQAGKAGDGLKRSTGGKRHLDGGRLGRSVAKVPLLQGRIAAAARGRLGRLPALRSGRAARRGRALPAAGLHTSAAVAAGSIRRPGSHRSAAGARRLLAAR